MDLDVDACYRAFRTRPALRRSAVWRGQDNSGLLPSDLPSTDAETGNMTFYATAAAAQEAGFRPCLRCRPETAPEFAAWRGTSNTVSRALALIDRGALDEGGIDRLAERLGVGERQLRRLFRQHLGASPVSVAQTRRVLLAKQLIHETRLPMAEVALASGFGSIRRFNEIFQRLFDRPPWCSAARHPPPHRPDRMAKSPSFSAIGPHTTGPRWSRSSRLAPSRASRWSRTIGMRGRSRSGCTALSRWSRPPGTRFGRDPILTVVGAADDHCARAARVRSRRRPASGQRAARRGSHPRPSGGGATRPAPGAWDGFELAVRAVLGQQITVAAGVGLVGKLVTRCGAALAGSGLNTEGLTHVFPRPEHVASADLTALGMPRMRAATLASLAAAVVADPHVLGAGRTLTECGAASCTPRHRRVDRAAHRDA